MPTNRRKTALLAAVAAAWLISLAGVLPGPSGDQHAHAQTDNPAPDNTTPNNTAPNNTTPSNSLPELGDSDSRYLSPAQEAEIGKHFQRQLLSSNQYIKDPELRNYLNRLGQRIADQADTLGLQLEFNLIRAPSLNAFAVPGGFITFHSGLVLETENESELAAVLGHEIAHLTQRHQVRLMAKLQRGKIPTAAAILGSILIGGQLGLAGLVASSANALSNRLAYTREFESEADALGMRYLAHAGFDPMGLPSFFRKLERYGRTQYEQIREFLRTHPLSYVRVAESESRLNAYPPATPPVSADYLTTKAKLRVIQTERQELPQLLGQFAERAKQQHGPEQAAAEYGMALTNMQQRNYAAAGTIIDRLLTSQPDTFAFHIAGAQIDTLAGRPAVAVKRLQALVKAHPEQSFLTFYLAEALLANRQPDEAKRVLRYQLRRHPDNFRFYPPLARAHGALGNFAEAHQATAEYLIALGAYKAAESALKLALHSVAVDSYLHRGLSARLEQVQQELLRRSGVRPL